MPGPATVPYRNPALKNTKDTATTDGGAVVTYVHIYNLDAATTYLQLYDALAANVTVGTTTPTYTIAVPTSGWIDNTDGEGIWRFQHGLVVAATTAIDGSGSAPTNGLLVNFGIRG